MIFKINFIYLKKKTFGKVPDYLQKIKTEIQNEYKTVREMQLRTQEEEDRKRKVLAKEEIEALKEGLEKKLSKLKIDYGVMSHKKVFDTLVLKKK